MTKEETAELRTRIDTLTQAKVELYSAERRVKEADIALSNYLYELQNQKKEIK